MINLKNNIQLFLSGGGNEQQSFPLDEIFFSSLPENANILYIPIALRGHQLYPTASMWIQSVIQLHNRNDIKIETMDEPEKYNFDKVKSFDAIYPELRNAHHHEV